MSQEKWNEEEYMDNPEKDANEQTADSQPESGISPVPHQEESELPKSNIEERPISRSQKNKRKRLDLYTLIIGISLGLLIGFMIGKPGSGKIAVNEKVYDGFVRSAVQNYKAASVHFDELTEREKKKLTEDERAGVFHSYLMHDRFDKALAIDPERAEDLVAHLAEKGNLSMVKNIEADLLPIQYEKAVLRHDYKKVLKLKDKVEDTERRRKNVIEALIMTGKTGKAVKYAKKHHMESLRLDMEQQFNRYATEHDITYEEQLAAMEKIRGLEE